MIGLDWAWFFICWTLAIFAAGSAWLLAPIVYDRVWVRSWARNWTPKLMDNGFVAAPLPEDELSAARLSTESASGSFTA